MENKKWKVTQKIMGGLGNQMFNYAYIKALSLRNNVDFQLDISPYSNEYKLWPYELNIFNISKIYASNKDLPFYERMSDWPIKWLLSRMNPYHHFENVSHSHPLLFRPEFLNIKEWYISWAFMSELYFKDYWNEVKKSFLFKKKISDKTKEIEKIIENENAVSVHIRRWDYLKHSDIYPELWKDYYLQAVELIKRKIEKPFFVFFSDDIEYARQNFDFLNDVLFVYHNRWEDSRQDMYLMSKCKHNITAHSTFSWRWAYLNDNKDKITISPKEWFVRWCNYYNNDIVPDSWIKI